MEKGFVSDGAYVLLGQIASATGTLVGVRVLTELLHPEVFGSVALITGVIALGQGISSGGLAQAILRIYPECAQNATLDLFCNVASRTLRTTTLWLSGVLAIGCLAYTWTTRDNPWLFILAPGLLMMETARLYGVTLLNAARRQRVMALWMGSESWVRTLCALASVSLVGASTAAVLGGFLVGTALSVLIWFSNSANLPGSGMRVAQVPNLSSVKRYEKVQDIRAEIIRYAKPLALLGVVGWLSGQADRYIIGGLLGLASAGQYAAIYGLVSRPFLMAGAGVELVFRQPLYESVSSDDLPRARRILFEWLGAVVVLGILGVIGFSLFSSNLASFLLAESYRESSHLMPWIAAGYCFLLFAQVIERVCYATKDTGSVLLIQSSGAIFSIPVSTVGVIWTGISGAAKAVPLYFGFQLCIALVVACKSARKHLFRARAKTK